MKLKSPACDCLYDGMIVICHLANFGKIVMGSFNSSPMLRTVGAFHHITLQNYNSGIVVKITSKCVAGTESLQQGRQQTRRNGNRDGDAARHGFLTLI